MPKFLMNWAAISSAIGVYGGWMFFGGRYQEISLNGFPAASHSFFPSAGSYLLASNSRFSLSLKAHLPKPVGTTLLNWPSAWKIWLMISWRSKAFEIALRVRKSFHFGLSRFIQKLGPPGFGGG